MTEQRHIPRAPENAEQSFGEQGLTDRERDAARSVLAGMTARDAAQYMNVDAETVASYRRRAYRKLGVSGARDLVARYGEKDAGPARDWRPELLARGLSATQADVLALVAEGLSSAEIAERLHLAAGTVSSARANGYRMLGVHSREGLVAALEAGAAAELERAEAPRRRRAGRLAAACVAAVVLLAALIASGQAVASMPQGEQASQPPEMADSPGALTPVASRGGVTSVAALTRDFTNMGATDVQFIHKGEVDEGCCVVVEALSDADPDASDGLEGATVYVTVTSVVEVPRVLDMTPIEAAATLLGAGLVPDPKFDTFQSPEGSAVINEPRVSSMSIDPLTEVAVGTIVHLEYNVPLDGYSFENSQLVPPVALQKEYEGK